MSAFFYGQKNYVDILNVMYDNFAAGPYNALPLSGGTMTGPVISSTGSAAAPSVGIGSAATGLYSSGTNQLSLSTASTERMRITANGDLGLFGVTPVYQAAYYTVALGASSTGLAGTILEFRDAAGAGRSRIVSNTSTALQLQAATSTGTISFSVNGSETHRVDSAGNLVFSGTNQKILGDFSSAATSRLVFQTSTANSTTQLSTIPSGTGTSSGISVFNNSSPANASAALLSVDSSAANVSSTKTGTGSYLPLKFLTSDVERMQLDVSGNIRFGSTSADPIGDRVNGFFLSQTNKAFALRSSASCVMGISGNSGTHFTFFTDNGSAFVGAGSVASSTTTTNYNTSSDYRLKTNTAPMVGALDSLMTIQFKTWDWINGGGPGEGVIAHELQEISNPIPSAASGVKDEEGINAIGHYGPIMQGVDYGKLVPRVGCALQELNRKFEAALIRIEELESKVAALEVSQQP